MGWLDSFFGSGSTDHRRYGDNEFYEYPRYGSGSSHSSSSGGWQGGSSSDAWRGPNIFEVEINLQLSELNCVSFRMLACWLWRILGMKMVCIPWAFFAWICKLWQWETCKYMFFWCESSQTSAGSLCYCLSKPRWGLPKPRQWTSAGLSRR